MELFKASRSKYKRVYGLPTLQGLVLGAIMSGALWFTIVGDSETERWLFLLMILLVLVHLTESSQPFRYMTVQILPFDPPFEGETSPIPVQIRNQTDFKLSAMSIKFSESREWAAVPAISRHSSALITLPFCFMNSGVERLPKLTIRISPTPKLFRYWRILDFSGTTYVLPKAVDHDVAAKPLAQDGGEAELTGVEQILDDRLLPLMDQKLFLKTGLPYRRIHQSLKANEQLSFVWSHLEALSHEKKGEQFSFWIKSASEKKGNIEVLVNTPFMTGSHGGRSINWRNLKLVFAKWFYAQS